MSLIAFVFMFIIVISTKTFAETNYNEISNNGSMTAISTQTSDSQLTEAETYKLLYENQKEFNGKILDTIYWALGAIGAAIIALLGGNIFFNYRVNKNEIENISQNLSREFEKFKNDSADGIQQKINESMIVNRDEFKNLSLNNQKEMQKYIDNQNVQIKSIKTFFDEALEEIGASVENNQRGTQRMCESLEKNFQRENKDLRVELNKLEAEKWRNKGVYQNVLACYVRAGNLEIELKLNIEDTIKNILEALENSSRLSNAYSTLLFQFIEKIPEKYSIQKEKINEIARSLPIQ